MQPVCTFYSMHRERATRSQRCHSFARPRLVQLQVLSCRIEKQDITQVAEGLVLLTWCCSKSSLTKPKRSVPSQLLSISCWHASILDRRPMPTRARSCPAAKKSPPSRKPGSWISPTTGKPACHACQKRRNGWGRC